MRVGTPGFIGARLREARAVRGITAAKLSAMTGVSTSVISAYERGHNSPSASKLADLAKALNFKTDFFMRHLNQAQDGRQVIFERSRLATTKAMRRKAEHRRVWLREIVEFLGQYLRIPVADLPNFGGAPDWRNMSDDDIENLAGYTRRHWKLGDGPISNVTLLAENNGVIVTQFPMDSISLDAFSAWDASDGRPYMVLGDDGQSAFRTRFNVCHELAHLIMHRSVLSAEFDDKRNFKRIEQQAHRFASAFLTPKATFPGDVGRPTLDALRIIKPKWKTSIKMLIHRSEELGMIGKDDARQLYINYNRRGWNDGEPHDQDLETERPRMVRRAFEALVDREFISRSQIPELLPFNREDIESVSGLLAGYFNEDELDAWDFIDELTAGFPT